MIPGNKKSGGKNQPNTTPGISSHKADIDRLNLKESRALLHELEAQQIELAMQNLELQEMRQKLEHSRDIYSDLYDHSPVGYLSLNPWGVIKNANLKISAQLGVERSYLIGMPFASFTYDTGNAKIFYNHLTGIFKKNPTGSCEIRLKSENTNPLYVRLESILIKDVEDLSTGCRTVAIDISETQQNVNRSENLSSNETLELLLEGSLGKFGKLFKKIQDTSTTPRDPRAWKPGELNTLETIKNLCRQGKTLISQIRSYRSEDISTYKPVQLAGILETCLQKISRQVPSGIVLHTAIGAPDAYISANTSDIEKLLGQLCSNAAEASSGAGSLIIICMEKIYLHQYLAEKNGLVPGEYLELTVNDNGRGVKAGDKNQIFHPFFSRSERGELAGMGLPVVKQIVTNHKGAISIDSARNKGTRVCVYFPTIANPVETTPEEIKKRILVIDDDENIRATSRIVLIKEGYEVITGGYPEEMLDLIRRDPDSFDMIITDYRMPKLDGAKLSREIHKINPKIPIIISTGLARQDIDARLFEEGIVDDILIKPYSLLDFRQVLKTYL